MTTRFDPLRKKVTVVSPAATPVYVPEKYTKTFVQTPIPNAPTGVVLSGIVRKASEGPVVGSPIAGRTVIIGQPTGTGSVNSVSKSTVITGSAGNTGLPTGVVLSGTVRKASEGPVVGNTLANQGLRTFGGKVVSAGDLQTISWSDTLKKDAEVRAAKGDLVSQIYLATDDPTVIGSAAWMEKQITGGLKSVGIKEEQYGPSGGPTTGNVVSDVLIEGVKGALLDFVPGTVRVLAAGAQGINLLKEAPIAAADEVLDSLKGGASNVVTGMIEAATTNPGRFVGGMLPGLLTGKLVSGIKAIPKSTKLTGTIPKGTTIITKVITTGKSAGKTVVKGTDDVLTSENAGVGILTKGAETFVKKQDTGAQWAVSYRLAAGERIDLAAAKRIVTEYKENPPLTKLDTVNVQKVEAAIKRGTSTFHDMDLDALKYIKKQPIPVQNYLISLWEKGRGGMTIKDAVRETKLYYEGIRDRPKIGMDPKTIEDVIAYRKAFVKPYELTLDSVKYLKKLPLDEQNYIMSLWKSRNTMTINTAVKEVKLYREGIRDSSKIVIDVTVDGILKNADLVITDVKKVTAVKTGVPELSPDVLNYIKKLPVKEQNYLFFLRETGVDLNLNTIKSELKLYRDAQFETIGKSFWDQNVLKQNDIKKLPAGNIKEVSADTVLKNTDIVIGAEVYKINKVVSKPSSRGISDAAWDYIQKLPIEEQRRVYLEWQSGVDITLPKAKAIVKEYRKTSAMNEAEIFWGQNVLKQNDIKKLTTGSIEEVTIENILRNTNKIIDVKLRLTAEIGRIGSKARTKATTTRAKVTKTVGTVKKKIARKKVVPAEVVVKPAKKQISVRKTGESSAKQRMIDKQNANRKITVKRKTETTKGSEKGTRTKDGTGGETPKKTGRSTRFVSEWEEPGTRVKRTPIWKEEPKSAKPTTTTREAAADAVVRVPQKNGMVMLQKMKVVSKEQLTGSKQKSASSAKPASVKTAPAKRKITVKAQQTKKIGGSRPRLRVTPTFSGLVKIDPGQGFPTLTIPSSIVRRLEKIPLDVVDLSLAIAMILGTPAKNKSMYDYGIARNTARNQNSVTSSRVTPDTTQNLGSTEISDVGNDVAQMQVPITLSGMDLGLTQIQTQILLTQPKLVERPKPKKPIVPKVPKKTTKRIKPSLEKSEETPKKKTKKVKRIKRNYTQLINPIPWLMDEGEDLSWLNRDLKKLSVPK